MIRQATGSDVQTVAAFALRLWPDHAEADLQGKFEALLSDPACAVFLYEADGEAAGFAQCQLRRDYVEGTETSPVGYLEGVFVAEPFRNRGVASSLLFACENWARERGCKEFASDCELTNTDSLRFHLSAGFSEANRIICFVKKL